MTKTWETLFNLSSFMKYLLVEVLPNEKVESPSYVLDSLYDLLTVTVACIEKIKSAPQDCMKTKNNITVHSAETVPSSRTNTRIDTSIVKNFTNNDTFAVSNLLERKVSLTPKSVSKENINNRVVNLESTSKHISEEFSKLSNEMHNGRPFGHYCRPCDMVIFSKKMWDIHNSDKLHVFLKENCENKHLECQYCNLSIFSTLLEAEHLMRYHQKQHLVTENVQQHLATNEVSFKTDYLTKENTKCVGANFETSNSEKVHDRCNDFEGSHGSEVIKTISPVFSELDRQMHLGHAIGFYCHTCDKTFDAVTKWNIHFQEEAAHVNQIGNSECFEMCDYCKLVIFAIPSIQKIYKAYHMLGHNSNRDEASGIKSSKSSTKTSMENIYLTTGDQSNQESSNFHESKGFNSRISSNTYIIAGQFKNFNTKIHSSNLHGYFYCRPCNASLSPDEWTKHSSEKKHVQLMGSRKFKNWKGTCAYCTLTILGTRDTVKYYMDYHGKGHKRVLSYDEERIYPTNIKSNPTGRFTSRFRAASPSNSVSTLGCDDDDDDEEEASQDESVTDETGNKADFINESKGNELSNSFTSDGNKETSWYSSSREEQLHFLVFKLVNSRLEQKQKSGRTNFGALCMVCEVTVESAFQWQDHLVSDDHRQRISSSDCEARINDLNVTLFGNSDVLEKYKPLVKGNLTFIES